jgi:hypothetical protein
VPDDLVVSFLAEIRLLDRLPDSIGRDLDFVIVVDALLSLLGDGATKERGFGLLNHNM